MVQNTLSQSLIGKRKKLGGLDFYPTPKNITKALMSRERFKGGVWECACGDGSMSKVIKDYNKVFSSDINPKGYGSQIDFLKTQIKRGNIITNPPFIIGEAFVKKAMTLATKKIAIFHRLLFLESARRFDLFNNPDFPFKKVYVFCKRQSLFENKFKKVSGTIAFAWFVWDKNYKGNPVIEWIKDD